MSVANLHRLGDLILAESSALMADWRRQVMQLPAARGLDRPTLDDHIPELLDELAAALQSRRDESIPEFMLDGTPPAHGRHRLEDGYDIEEVVAEYNILRGCLHDLAERHGMVIQGTTFHILNRVLDTAIGLAVQTYATQRALEVQHRREEYLAFVAHDLRTPLQALALSAKLLELQLCDQGNDSQVRQALTALERNVRHLDSLVETVLKENTIETGDSDEEPARRHLDLWPLVESLFYDIRPVADTNSTALVNQVPIDLTVHADAGMLTRILQNLVSNAIKFTPRGEIVVGAHCIDDDGSVECWVTDNGSGLDQEELKEIFERIEAGTNGENGHGLGLAIVRQFVELHGGTVSVESEPDVKTTFRFTLLCPDC